MQKIVNCKTCSNEIASNAKTCPSCGAKNKKPFYKKIWFWIVAIIIVAGIAGSGGENSTATNTKTNENSQEVSQTEKEEANVPTEYKSALKKAKIYSDTMHMSKAGIYDQLTSEYGEKFSKEAAQYAVDNVKADWKENALKKAQDYQKQQAMSPSAIYDQLTSDYGEKFTPEEAQYAINNLN